MPPSFLRPRTPVPTRNVHPRTDIIAPLPIPRISDLLPARSALFPQTYARSGERAVFLEFRWRRCGDAWKLVDGDVSHRITSDLIHRGDSGQGTPDNRSIVQAPQGSLDDALERRRWRWAPRFYFVMFLLRFRSANFTRTLAVMGTTTYTPPRGVCEPLPTPLYNFDGAKVLGMGVGTVGTSAWAARVETHADVISTFLNASKPFHWTCHANQAFLLERHPGPFHDSGSPVPILSSSWQVVLREDHDRRATKRAKASEMTPGAITTTCFRRLLTSRDRGRVYAHLPARARLRAVINGFTLTRLTSPIISKHSTEVTKVSFPPSGQDMNEGCQGDRGVFDHRPLADEMFPEKTASFSSK